MKIFRYTLAVIAIGAAVSVSPVGAQAGKEAYLKDFEFIRDTVKENGAAIERHDLDWAVICEEAEPRFAGAQSDAQHVANVMRLLATLRDSHTSITETSVPEEELPKKWDGFYGGGLWFGWEDGRFVLRGRTLGHYFGGVDLIGGVLLGINQQPTWFVIDKAKRQITEYFGSSSDHSLYASMGNRLLPFGEAKEVELSIMRLNGSPYTEFIGRWSREGKPCHPYIHQLPVGIEWKEGAVSAMQRESWCENVGYIRITGSMEEPTVEAFHSAFDKLQDAEAMILDCRGMGGGSDKAAWEMAGRFFKKSVSNGAGKRIDPTGSWQFDGPLVMLQDEREVSAAETFTWAMCETKRAFSVGRPTGGWAIIPESFQCPSGLVSFRLGVHDRPTPILGKMTEGIGWPPDVPFPYGPLLCENRDRDGNIALQILRLLHAGIDRLTIIRCFNHLRTGKFSEFLTDGKKTLTRKAKGWDPKLLAELFHEDLKATIELETFLLTNTGDIVPDVAGSARRFLAMAPRARNANLSAEFTEWQRALAPLKAEAEAQNAFLEMPSSELDPKGVPWKVFLTKHGETRTGKFLAGAIGQP